MLWLLCPDARMELCGKMRLVCTGDLARYCYASVRCSHQHTAGRATHCYVSYLLHTSDCSLLTLHTPCLRVSRVSTQSHDIRQLTVPSSHPALSWLARRDLRIPRPSPLLSGQPLAKQQNTSVFGKYTREQFWTRKMIAKLCWFFRWCNCSGNIKYPPIVRSGSSPDSFPCHEPTV